MERPPSSAIVQGLVFALAGYVLLSIGDAVVKTMTPHWPAPAIAALRYLLGTIGLGVILWVREGPAAFRMGHYALHGGRALAVSFSAICFFIGITLIPLADATAMTFVMPMLTSWLAAIFLKERVSRPVWIASLLAFAGVMMILRPNLLGAGLAAVLPLGAALGMAILILLNAKVAGRASVLAMQFIVAALATPVLILAAVLGHVSGVPSLQVTMPDWSVVARCAFVAVSASTAHTLIFLATTRASAATIAPMTYAQLLVAMIISTFVFDHPPDQTSLAGSALIVGAGLYLWRKTRPSAA